MEGSCFGMVPRAVLTDQSLGHAAVRLYGVLASYANQRFECWPSQDTLRADLGLSDVRGVRTLIGHLEAAGYLVRRPRFGANGIQVGCLYRLCISVGNQQTVPGLPESAYPDSHAPGDPDSQSPPEQTTSEHTIKKQNPSPQMDLRSPNVLQLFPEPAAKQNRSSGKPDGEFDRFWSLYPRKVGKGQARTAWGTAIRRKASVADILQGLRRANQRWADDGTEGQFIPHPATWLNGERWADDPLPLPPPRRAVADYRERYPDIPG